MKQTAGSLTTCLLLMPPRILRSSCNRILSALNHPVPCLLKPDLAPSPHAPPPVKFSFSDGSKPDDHQNNPDILTNQETS